MKIENGHESFRPTCELCGKLGDRSARWDSYACVACDVWIEKSCDNPVCNYCTSRPNRPSQVED